MRLANALALAAVAFSLNPAFAQAPAGPADGNAVSKIRVKQAEWSRPLGAASEDLRFSGEIESRLLPFYVSRTEAARGGKLRLTYVNAVSVLPEMSRLTVLVNDTPVGERVVKAGGTPETLVFDLPPTLLDAGYNALRITVHQQHRVDCSLDASFELWTQIIPEQSATVFSVPPADIRDTRELAGLARGADGQVRILARVPAGAGPTSLTRISRAVQSAVILGGFQRPVLELDAEASTDPDLDLMVGTARDLQAWGQSPKAGPSVTVEGGAEVGRTRLVVSGNTDEELEAAVSALENQAREAKPVGSAAGLIALRAQNGAKVEGGETIALAKLGIASQLFSGRYFRQTAKLTLPPDFYAAAYDRMTMALDAGYVANLQPDSKITLRVNGAHVASVALAKPAGALFRKRAVDLPLEAFKAGVNAIDIEAQTLTAADAACGAGATLDGRDRFFLASTTELQIPRLARVANLPNLSAVPAGGFKLFSGTDDLAIFVPAQNHDAQQAALTLVAKIASISGAVTRGAFTFHRPEGVRHVIAVAPIDMMSDAVLKEAGLDSAALRQAWQSSTGPVAARFGEHAPIRIAQLGGSLPSPLPRSEVTDAQTEDAPGTTGATEKGISSGSGSSSLRDLVRSHEVAGTWSSLQEKAAKWLQQLPLITLDVQKIGLIRRESEPLAVSRATALVIAQDATTAGLDSGVWRGLLPPAASMTVVTAPTGEMLRNSVPEFLNGALWQRLVGQAAAFDRDERTVITRIAASQALVETQPLTFTNARLIGAAWLSQNSPLYLTALFSGILFLSLLLYSLVRVSGVRN
jgi:cellulose synthase operon protein B